MAANMIRYSDGTEHIVQIASQIEVLSDEFENEYNKMYSMIEGELSAAWKGEDADTFRERVGDMRKFFITMHESMCDYASFLRKTAIAHEERMEKSRSQAESNISME